MNEFEIINTVKGLIGSEFIGDDCAYLKDLGIVISQDNLVENIHFKTDWCSPYELGYKSAVVNISDILASGGKPEYMTIALSLPKSINNNFIDQFYSGVLSALNGIKIIGGDITGSKNDIMISITAIGTTLGRNISSRSNAQPGYAVITKGNFGSSAAGLHELLHNGNNNELINAHLNPVLEYDFADNISKMVAEKYAMMDSSDGLADTLFKIADASNVKIIVDYNKIPHLPNINKQFVLYGGEDYKLVAAVPIKYVTMIPDAVLIGYVYPYDGIRLDISGEHFTDYQELNLFNHFE